MRKSLYILLSIFCIQTGNAQVSVSGKYIGNPGVGSDLSIQNNDGKLIPIGAREDAKGTPFFLEGWLNASVYLINGGSYTDTAFNYSLFDDKLYFNRDSKLFLVTDQVKTFILTTRNINDKATTNIISYQFSNGYPAINGTNENTFFQLLVSGSHYQLLKWQHKNIRENYTYGSKLEYEYVSQFVYYIFDNITHQIFPIGNKANAAKIKSTLSVDESIWKAYLNNHTANTKNEQAMIDFIIYLNAVK